jgi:hypothetical protein
VGGDRAEVYDPGSGSWTPPPGRAWPPERNYAPLILMPDGRLLVFGSADGTSVELYDPACGTWTPTASMATPRRTPTATPLADGRVLVAGGYWGQSSLFDPTLLASAERYDPGSP